MYSSFHAQYSSSETARIVLICLLDAHLMIPACIIATPFGVNDVIMLSSLEIIKLQQEQFPQLRMEDMKLEK